jgi:Restriction endonuclease/NACHT domain
MTARKMTTITKDLSGKAFEREVADAYRALGYAVTENERLAGKQTDLIARREIDGAPGIKLAVECKDTAAAIGNAVVETFVSRIDQQCRANLVSAGALVSRNGFTTPAREVAKRHNTVSLLSWDELTSAVLDVRAQLREAVEQYEKSDIFGHYLPLTLERLSWDTMAPEGRPSSTEAAVSGWLAASSGETRRPNVLVVLADFGAGKSTLLHRVHYERSTAFLAGDETRVPLFVPLRDFRHTQDVTALVRMAFRDAYFRDLPSDLLWQRLNAGRFHLLLDGFDEMGERSDTARRLELFGMLVPLLVSPCPVILTSRPSHFVERGELNHLLAMLLDADTKIGARRRSHGADSAAADHLRRELVSRFRETRPGRTVVARLVTQNASVYRLRPLTKAQIKDFVATRKDDLREAKSSPAAVVKFIERTYDLTDLATRPMLLAFIVESVIIGALDPNRSEELGAAGLYDNYTLTKLELDTAKGPTRARGLPVELRRRMAEDLAVILYSDGVLETSFKGVIPRLIAGIPEIGQERRQQGLSLEEIATDFATSSFITLTEDGECRFVHKSFRGFFVARVIKNTFPELHPLLETRLEQEVLYFLGGFVPTEPALKERLWSYTSGRSATERRNALVAFLYTRPQHERMVVYGGEISEARFGRLGLVDSKCHDVLWRDVAVQELDVTDSEWHGVRFEGSHLAKASFAASRLDVHLVSTTAEALVLSRLWGSTWTLEDTMVDDIEIDVGNVTVTAGDAKVGRVVVGDSRISLKANDSVVEEMKLTDSGLRIIEGRVDSLIADRSVVELPSEGCIGRGRVVDSLVVIGEKRRSRAGEPERLPPLAFRVAGSGVVVCRPGTYIESPEGVDGGVFGEIENLRGVTGDAKRLWGVVHSDDLLKGVDGELSGIRIGDLVVTSKHRYEEAMKPRGLLRALSAVNTLAERHGVFTSNDVDTLRQVLGELRKAWQRAVEKGWGDGG